MTLSERVKEKEGWTQGWMAYKLTVSERVKEKEGWIQAWGWPHSGAWDCELTVSERVKEKEGWIQAWMTSFLSMGL